jgi:hypothetical protein
MAGRIGNVQVDDIDVDAFLADGVDWGARGASGGARRDDGAARRDDWDVRGDDWGAVDGGRDDWDAVDDRGDRRVFDIVQSLEEQIYALRIDAAAHRVADGELAEALANFRCASAEAFADLRRLMDTVERRVADTVCHKCGDVCHKCGATQRPAQHLAPPQSPTQSPTQSPAAHAKHSQPPQVLAPQAPAAHPHPGASAVGAGTVGANTVGAVGASAAEGVTQASATQASVTQASVSHSLRLEDLD